MRNIFLLFVLSSLVGCGQHIKTSDDIDRIRQEKLLAEASAQVGMPAIKNFREKKILRDIIELRDQDGIVTYTYLENMVPTIVAGHTALGGKLTYVGESIGYGISAATQFTNPQKIESEERDYGYAILPQADPNGLFSPASTEGTWIMMLDRETGKVRPQYFEPRIVVSTFRYQFDAISAEK